MKRYQVLLIIGIIAAGCQSVDMTPTPTASPRPSATPRPTQTPTPTPTAFPLDTSDPGIAIAVVPGPEGSLYRLGIGWREDVTVSPDGQWLALTGSTGLYVYRTDTLELEWRADNLPFASQAQWSPDGNQLVVVYGDTMLASFDSATGDRLQSFPVIDRPYYDEAPISISGDNQLVRISNRLYSLTTGEEIACFGCVAVAGSRAGLAAATFIDQQTLRAVVSCEEGTFCVWQSDGQDTVPYALNGRSEDSHYSISPDGRWVVAQSDETFSVVNLDTGEVHPLADLDLGPDVDEFYASGTTFWAPDSSAFVIGGDGEYLLYRADSDTSLMRWNANTYIYFLWSPDSRFLLRGYDYDASLYVVHEDEAVVVRELEGSGALALLPRGQILWGAPYFESGEGLRLSQGDSDDYSHELITDLNRLERGSVGWTPDNLLMTILNFSGKIQFFDGATGQNVASVDTGLGDMLVPHFRDFQWSSDGRYLAWDTDPWDGPTMIWDREKDEFKRLTGSDAHALSADGSLLLEALSNGSLLLLDVATKQSVDRAGASVLGSDGIIDLAWSPDASQFVTINEWKTIEPILVWDTETFSVEYTLMPDWEDRTSFNTINWGGSIIAARSWNDIFAWDSRTQELLWSATFDNDDSCSVLNLDRDNLMAFTPDGRYLAVVAGNYEQGCGQIAVYNGYTGDLLHTYPGNLTHPLINVAWSPDGQYLASVALNDTIVVWDTSILPPVEIP